MLRERERVREHSKNYGGELRDAIFGWRKSMILLEGSQAMPTRPSEKGRIRVKTSECY
jgi:hypothetical protein